MPMLRLFRRHLKACPHRGWGYRRCACPIHVDGRLGGKYLREALDTQNWQKAQDTIREWEAKGRIEAPPDHQPDLIECCQRFTSEAEKRGLAASTLKKYRVLIDQLKTFAAGKGIRFASQITLSETREFRQSWKDESISAGKKLERLRSLFKFFHESGWIAENFAKKLKPPKITEPPTLPFTREEMTKLIGAVPRMPCVRSIVQEQMTALMLLLRYTGLRIGDAVTLHRTKLSGTRLLLYTQKTRVPVYLPLPDFVVSKLIALEQANGYYFCTGKAKASTDAGNWRRRFRKLFKLAGLPEGHPHRFRDTFAVELLLSGVTIEQVAALLGHKSTKITEKHYSPWVKSRQVQLEAAVERAIQGEVLTPANERDVWVT